MSYKTFYRVFLLEMPQRLNGGNSFVARLEMIRENLRYNSSVIQLAPSVYKTQNGMQITYWMGTANASEVQVIVDTEQFVNFRKVTLTSKDPLLPAGSPPYASDLYVLIKRDAANDNLVFTSDEYLSDSGIRLWQNIVSQGYAVAVYDKSRHQYILSRVTDSDQLLDFVGDADKRKYIFVLSESIQYLRGVMHSFALMDIKRQAGYPLFEDCVNEN